MKMGNRLFMKITKYGHSCVLIEENGKRLLFDPGLFVFIEGRIKPEDIGPVDAVLITHTHPDHYYPEALKKLYELRPFTLVASQGTKETMDEDGLGLPVQVIAAGHVTEVAGFRVETFDCPHEKIPMACPHNMGYKINNSVYHPGDSYVVPGAIGPVKVLLLPNGGPWATTLQTVAFAKAIKPEIAIPIHDGMHKEFWLERLNASTVGWMKDMGVECRVLAQGESTEID